MSLVRATQANIEPQAPRTVSSTYCSKAGVEFHQEVPHAHRSGSRGVSIGRVNAGRAQVEIDAFLRPGKLLREVLVEFPALRGFKERPPSHQERIRQAVGTVSVACAAP